MIDTRVLRMSVPSIYLLLLKGSPIQLSNIMGDSIQPIRHLNAVYAYENKYGKQHVMSMVFTVMQRNDAFVEKKNFINARMDEYIVFYFFKKTFSLSPLAIYLWFNICVCNLPTNNWHYFRLQLDGGKSLQAIKQINWRG